MARSESCSSVNSTCTADLPGEGGCRCGERPLAAPTWDRTLPPMPRPGTPDSALAVVGGRLATALVDVPSDLAALDSPGCWAVVLPCEGAQLCARFATVPPPRPRPA